MSENTDRKCRPFLLFNQTTGLNIPISQCFDPTLVLAGKSLFRMLFIGVLLILLGPFTSHSTQGDLPDDPGPSSSRPKKASLQHLSVGQSPTASCFIELAAASILFL